MAIYLLYWEEKKNVLLNTEQKTERKCPKENLWTVYNFRVCKLNSNSWMSEWKLLNRAWFYTIHGILQATILEWVAFPSSRGSSQPRDQTQISCAVGGFFTSWATREAWYEDRSSFLPLRSSFACLIKNNIYSYFNVQFKAISPIVHLEFPPFSCVPTVVWFWLQSFLGKMNRTSWLTECGLESIFLSMGSFH